MAQVCIQTTDAYQTVIAIDTLGGVRAFGCVKNIDGANSLTVKITAVDTFDGATASQETVVAPAAVCNFDSIAKAVSTLTPPYSSLKVEVKSTSAGLPAWLETNTVQF
jgi:hypothetical protein